MVLHAVIKYSVAREHRWRAVPNYSMQQIWCKGGLFGEQGGMETCRRDRGKEVDVWADRQQREIHKGVEWRTERTLGWRAGAFIRCTYLGYLAACNRP